MAAVLAALRRVARPSAAAPRRLSGVPDEIAELQRASVAALHRSDASGDAAASALQEPGPEDCCVRARGRAPRGSCVPARAHAARSLLAAQNRGCAQCVWTVYTESLAQAQGRSRADDAAAPAALDAAQAQAHAGPTKDDSR